MDIYYKLFPKVTEKVHTRFIDTGCVPKPILEFIAKKLINSEPLEAMEVDIFFGKTSEINEIIRDFKK